MNFIKGTDTYCSIENNVPAPILRKGFDLDFTPKTASLSICVSGFYDLFVNGEKITKGLLAPYINNPDHIMYYDKYDITHLLKKGKNAIAVILGNGFANQDVDSWNFKSSSFRAPLCMALDMIAEGEGKSFTISSDESFKTHPSPILFDMYRYGVIYDARKEIVGFADGVFDDSSWDNAISATPPKGKITLSEALPVKEQYELIPKKIEKQEDFCYLHTDEDEPIMHTHVKEGWLYDFGLNCSGVCRLKIKGKCGQKITLRHGEYLRNGNFNINSILTIKEGFERYIHLHQADTYILRGGDEEIFIPPFTYHGFRYVLVEGITDDQATQDLLTYIVFNTDIKKRSDFHCSDPVLNKLYEMAIRSDLSNFHHFPTDCPHREKNGWTGDISVSAHQYLLSFDCSQNFDVWLENVQYAQTDEGQIPGIVPTDTWGYKWGSGPAWDSAIINVPYYCYKYDGKKDIITKNSDMIIKYLKYIAEKRNEDGLVACGLGDWVQPREDGEKIASPLLFTDSTQVLEMAHKSAIMFEAIGKNGEKAFAQKLEKEMREAIRKHLIDFSTYTVAGNCQTSQAIALRMGLFNENEYQKAYQRLIDFIKEKDYHTYCGMLGLRHIFHVLFENNDADIALKMITREDAPSYGNMIKLGGTALFEATRQNGVQNSQNHHFYGDIINLFITKIVGIRINPEMDDTHNVIISPMIPDGIENACASYEFKEGTLTVAWKKENGILTLNVIVPPSVHGKIIIGNESILLKTGNNSFSKKLDS